MRPPPFDTGCTSPLTVRRSTAGRHGPRAAIPPILTIPGDHDRE
ncbi:hypothetical protein ACFFX0_19280 [Citricoccus parietis]|uniref:Uncharacterized protein n=1 Tax=Citricoccus parietis TaxID=592307 RepID=A0ABV5G2Q7_9MICC